MHSWRMKLHTLGIALIRKLTEYKVQVIKNLPEPNNVKELQAFLGMLNYYGCYLPNLATVLAPLHGLLDKDVAWSWGPKQSKAMQKTFEIFIITCSFRFNQEDCHVL